MEFVIVCMHLFSELLWLEPRGFALSSVLSLYYILFWDRAVLSHCAAQACVELGVLSAIEPQSIIMWDCRCVPPHPSYCLNSVLPSVPKTYQFCFPDFWWRNISLTVSNQVPLVLKKHHCIRKPCIWVTAVQSYVITVQSN